MSTTKNLTVYKGLPTVIKSRAKGYWDNITIDTFTTDGVTKSITMSVYDGLSCSTSLSPLGTALINFDGTVLPYKWDYNNTLNTSKYCFKPAGQNYKIEYYKYSNFSIMGSPTVNADTGLASGFSSSNYLILPEIFTPDNKTWEICAKFTTPSTLSNDKWAYGSNTNVNCKLPLMGYSAAAKFYLLLSSNGSSWNLANNAGTTTTVLPNTTYWLKTVYSGTDYKLLSSTDGENWTLELTIDNSTPVYNNQANYYSIGANTANSTWQIFDSTVDLSGYYIKIDNEIWWEAKSLYNYQTHGNPTVSSANVMSGFSATTYVNAPVHIDSNVQKVEFYMKAKFSSSVGWQIGLANVANGNMLQLIKIFNSTHLGIIYPGSGGDVGTGTLTNNSTYWFKCLQENGVYTLYYKTDAGESLNEIRALTTGWNTCATANYNLFYVGGENMLWFGRNPDSNYSSQYWAGNIDFANTALYADDELIWQKDVTINKTELPGITDDYTDDGSAVTMNCFALGNTSVVLTEDNDYEGGTYLGTVSIPSHTA